MSCVVASYNISCNLGATTHLRELSQDVEGQVTQVLEEMLALALDGEAGSEGHDDRGDERHDDDRDQHSHTDERFEEEAPSAQVCQNWIS